MDGMHNSNSIIWDRDIRIEDTEGAPGLQPQEMPDRSAGTAVLEREETDEKSRRGDDGDNDRYAHYVSKERLEQARITGRPVIALCGKVWIPKRNPERYPVCPECKKVYSQMRGSGSSGF